MKFLWSTLTVKNMEESLKFYQEIVGLPVSRRFKTEGAGEIVFLGDGETKLELICSGTNQDVQVGTDISIGFAVESVDEKIQFIKDRGLEIAGGPFEPNPHTKFFYVRDPNGLKVQFVENR